MAKFLCFQDSRANHQNDFIQWVSRSTWLFGDVSLLVLMLQCWRMRKRPTKEEKQFGAELTLKYCPQWDPPFLMFQSEPRVIPQPLISLWFINTRHQTQDQFYSMHHMFLTWGNGASNELLSSTNSAQWAEQQNFAFLLMPRPKTNACFWTVLAVW